LLPSICLALLLAAGCGRRPEEGRVIGVLIDRTGSYDSAREVAASTLKGLQSELRYGDTILWRCVWPRNSSRDAGSADIGFEVAPRKREKTVAKMIALAESRAGRELGSSCTRTLADLAADVCKHEVADTKRVSRYILILSDLQDDVCEQGCPDLRGVTRVYLGPVPHVVGKEWRQRQASLREKLISWGARPEAVVIKSVVEPPLPELLSEDGAEADTRCP
jgi:hypothetical protein